MGASASCFPGRGDRIETLLVRLEASTAASAAASAASADRVEALLTALVHTERLRGFERLLIQPTSGRSSPRSLPSDDDARDAQE